MTTYHPDRKEASDAGLEAVVTRGLEHPAQPAIPADFAARVRASLPPLQAPSRHTQAARTVAIAAALLLAVALFLVAPHTAPTLTSLAFDLELLLLAQLFGITYWLAARQSK